MRDQQPVLRIHAEQGSDAYVIRVGGELDEGGCPDVDVALDTAEETEARQIILDLEELTFIDSAGLGTLVRACRRSARNGNRLQLTRGTGFLADMFRLTTLDAELPLIDPALCPAIKGQRAGRASGFSVAFDQANRPCTGEQFVDGPRS